MTVSDRRLPNLEGQVPVFISPRNMEAQTLGSIFVASYDSQAYSRGIQTRLHAGVETSFVDMWIEGMDWDCEGINKSKEKSAKNNGHYNYVSEGLIVLLLHPNLFGFPFLSSTSNPPPLSLPSELSAPLCVWSFLPFTLPFRVALFSYSVSPNFPLPLTDPIRSIISRKHSVLENRTFEWPILCTLSSSVLLVRSGLPVLASLFRIALFKLGLILHPEDRSKIFLRNTFNFQSDYKVSHTGR
jgi:hypothetical protein